MERQPPRVLVRARDIDGVIGHLFVDGVADTQELRDIVEGQMDRIEIELTSAMVDTFIAIEDFKPLAETQLPAKNTLDLIEDLLIHLKPNLLQVMERRSFGHFIHFIGGLRSGYLSLLEMFLVIKRVLRYHTERTKPVTNKSRSLSNVIQDSSAWHWVKGKRELPTINEDGDYERKLTRVSSGSTFGIFSKQAPYASLHELQEHTIRMSQANGILFKRQLESTVCVLKHISGRLRVILGFWEPATSEGDLAIASHSLKFTPFKPISDLFVGHDDLDPAEVSGKFHFGFTYARSLVEYSKKLKAMYCAVSDAQQWKDSKLLSNTWFYSAAARYFLSPELASSYYEDVRRNLGLDIQRQVWNLMEDPVIEFFATALGLNPRKIDLPVDSMILLESEIVPLTIEQLEKQSERKERTDLEKLSDSQYFDQYYKKSVSVRCHYLFSREVEIDGRLYPSMSGEEDYSAAFSLNSLRSLFERPKRSGSDPTLSSQRTGVNIKEVGEKLSQLSATTRGYFVLADKPEKKSESSMYSDKASRFERKRDNFLDSSPETTKEHTISWSTPDEEFSEVDITHEKQEDPDSSTSPRVGKILDLDFDPGEEAVIEDDIVVEELVSGHDSKFSGVKVTGQQNTTPLKEYSPVVILHMHGGGWISQSPRTHLAYLRTWAKQTNLPIVSVDYGLSPENEFPSALNQCFAAYQWILNPDNAQSLGLAAFESSPRVILAGDSAGGNLCCSLTTRIIQERIPKPIGMLLSYPVVMMTASGSISRMVFAQDPVLNFQSMQIVMKSYMGARSDLAEKEPLISPALLDDSILRQFPQTCIMVGDTDPIIDDSTFFFYKLRESVQANVPTKLQIYRRLPHGYLNLPSQLPNAPLAISDAAKFIKMMMADDDKLRGFTVL